MVGSKSSLNDRVAHIREILGARPYSLMLLPLSLLYAIGILVFLYSIYGSPAAYIHSSYWYHSIPFIAFGVVNSILFGVSLTLSLAKIKEIRLQTAGLGLTSILFGSLAIGCPGCFFGLFPVVLSFFGITGTLALLPLHGVEFQLLTLAVLLVSIYSLGARTVVSCDILARKNIVKKKR
jgi:hypothetical protein